MPDIKDSNNSTDQSPTLGVDATNSANNNQTGTPVSQPGVSNNNNNNSTIAEATSEASSSTQVSATQNTNQSTQSPASAPTTPVSQETTTSEASESAQNQVPVVEPATANNTTTQPATEESKDSNSTATIVTIILFIVFYPLGVIVMWFWPKWKSWVKILLTIPFVLGLIGLAFAMFFFMRNPGALDSTNTNVVPGAGRGAKNVCVSSCQDLYPDRGPNYQSCISTCDDF